MFRIFGGNVEKDGFGFILFVPIFILAGLLLFLQGLIIAGNPPGSAAQLFLAEIEGYRVGYTGICSNDTAYPEPQCTYSVGGSSAAFLPGVVQDQGTRNQLLKFQSSLTYALPVTSSTFLGLAITITIVLMFLEHTIGAKRKHASPNDWRRKVLRPILVVFVICALWMSCFLAWTAAYSVQVAISTLIAMADKRVTRGKDLHVLHWIIFTFSLLLTLWVQYTVFPNAVPFTSKRIGRNRSGNDEEDPEAGIDRQGNLGRTMSPKQVSRSPTRPAGLHDGRSNSSGLAKPTFKGIGRSPNNEDDQLGPDFNHQTGPTSEDFGVLNPTTPITTENDLPDDRTIRAQSFGKLKDRGPEKPVTGAASVQQRENVLSQTILLDNDGTNEAAPSVSSSGRDLTNTSARATRTKISRKLESAVPGGSWAADGADQFSNDKFDSSARAETAKEQRLSTMSGSTASAAEEMGVSSWDGEQSAPTETKYPRRPSKGKATDSDNGSGAEFGGQSESADDEEDQEEGEWLNFPVVGEDDEEGDERSKFHVSDGRQSEAGEPIAASKKKKAKPVAPTDPSDAEDDDKSTADASEDERGRAAS